MLDKTKLAEAINIAIDATDEDGNSIEVTPEMEVYSGAVIATFQAAIFAHPIVTGTTTAGSPLADGAAAGGKFTVLLKDIWLAGLVAGFPTADAASLDEEATCSTTYLLAASTMEFAAGDIVGTCTSTTEAPGPLVAGAGAGGVVQSIVGEDWAKLCIPPTGDPALAKKIYQAIGDYLRDNAEGLYAANAVNGICPSGSGPLAGGVGVGGTVI